MKHDKLQYWIRVTLFAAILLLLTITGLGYIKAGALNITILTVPIAICAITMGPTAGAVLGLVFGLTSLWSAMSGSGGMTTTLFQYNVPGTIFLCVVPRVLMGWLCGYVYKGLKRGLGENVFIICVTCLWAPLLNCVFFMGTLILLFANTPVFSQFAGEKTAWLFVWGVFMTNGIAETVICGFIGTAVAKTLLIFLKLRK